MGRLPSADPPASSSHSLHSIDDAPPPYSDDPEVPVQPHFVQVQPVQPVQPPTSILPLRLIDSAYVLPGSPGTKPHDKVALSLSPGLSSNCDELYNVIHKQIKLPPRPLLHIRGTHTETSQEKKNERNSNTVTDFQFRLDLAETMLTGWEPTRMELNWMQVEILTDEDLKPAYRGGILRSPTYEPPKSRAISLDEDTDALLNRHDGQQNNLSPAEKDLRMWCERFCHDPAPVKSFTLHREVRGFDSNAMRNVLSSHIRELNYRGNISISLATAHHSVTIYSPHWINRLRANRAVWWTVVILQLWIITWPIIFFIEKRYEIAHTRWNASLVPEEAASPLAKCYAFGRSESALAEYWAPAVKQAAWSRRQDSELLTRMDADRLQGYSTQQLLGLRVPDSDAELERRGRVNSGEGGFVDNVVGLVRGIGEVSQDWRFASGWGANC
ncbi:hypothetical protein N7457_005518 [Penicillium paradoxum]|uniref:uncharacterized protein n=1 Tax=Penicillium paradoxum TaxID=176176 RepID=UPI0025489AB2|nr:uncharacterized protein N7457_005518 [Penicillium paradoxum]KAJ5780358.1 hypothetical protein N7457_005518 [Penicillium paradoxum]